MQVQEEQEISFERALGVLRRRAPWILLCVVLAAGAAFAYSTQQTKQYTATASLVFSDNQLNQQIAGLQPTASSDSQIQQATNVELVRLGNTSARTADILGGGLTEEDVEKSLDITAVGTTNVVDVSATSSPAQRAAAIANTYSEQFVRAQRITNQRALRSALAVVNRRLEEMSPEERSSPGGLDLQDRAQSLAILAKARPGVHVAQAATVPTEPSSPDVARNVVVGAALGLLIGLACAFLLERFDRRIREPKDLEAIYGAPLIGIVPQSDAIGRSMRLSPGPGGDVLPPSDAEAFRMIRAHLHHLNVDRDLRTLLVVSAAPGEGKTTVARHLAEADAVMRRGAPLLIEADLRAPALATQLAMASGLGLSDVLSRGVPLSYAVQSLDVGPGSDPGSGPDRQYLDVLAAGPMQPPNPGQLLASGGMRSVLEEARRTHPFIVIDAPPLAAVSDAFPLLNLVDGVVVVGRIGHSHRDVAKQLSEALRKVDAPVLGVIANGVEGHGFAPYARAYGEPGGSNPAVEPEEMLTLHRPSETGLVDGNQDRA